MNTKDTGNTRDARNTKDTKDTKNTKNTKGKGVRLQGVVGHLPPSATLLS
jgi:hypothetical protein